MIFGRWLLAAVAFALVACGGSSKRNLRENEAAEGGDAGESARDGGSGGRGTTGGTTGRAGGTSGDGGSTAGNNAGVAGETTPVTSEITPVRLRQARPLDLLFMIDNSIGMADKQRLLTQALPTLFEELDRLADITDIHFGVITSSLGHHGSHDVCSDSSSGRTPDDRAELIGSIRVDVPGNSDGFLEWQPGGTASETASNLSAQIGAAGELGCGYEGSLEAWYRFLVDPEPVAEMDTDGTQSLRGAVNATVLAQRAAFLRPDSLVGIVMLTDENDCSILDEDMAQGWLVGYKGGPGNNNWRMPAATASCAEDPNSRCCRTCLVPPDDPDCPDNDAEGCPASLYLDAAHDSMNQRCFQQPQRFGVSLLYPTFRYVEALTSLSIKPRLNRAPVENPLFTSGARAPGDVFLAGILGVPWQDIATDESLSGDTTLDFLTSAELSERGRWDMILGDPEQGVLPADPLMMESIDPRPEGLPHPLLSDAAIAPAGDPESRNPVNGREQVVDPQSRDDLQFACIFPLSEPVPCEALNAAGCDCNAEESVKSSPLCDYPSPGADGTQIAAKAYPSLRQLEVLKGLGEQGLVTSVCPKNVAGNDAEAGDPNYGYNPVVRAVARLLEAGARADCLARALPVDATDGGKHLACPLIVTTPDCSCDASRGLALVEDQAVWSAAYAATGDTCLCELQQLTGDALATCQNDADSPKTPGFCYVDAANGSVNPGLVADCPAGRQRMIRFSETSLEAISSAFVVCPPAE